LGLLHFCNLARVGPLGAACSPTSTVAAPLSWRRPARAVQRERDPAKVSGTEKRLSCINVPETGSRHLLSAESATRACELTVWQQPGCLVTLAAAYAGAGDFDAAVRWQARAIEFLMDEREEEKGDFRSRLVLYQAKKPYREASPGRAPIQVRP